jgi:glucosamine kinase
MTKTLGTHTYLVGVDGGGTGTRVVLADTQGTELARATGGPSGLALGVEAAWRSIEAACSSAFGMAGIPFSWEACTLGCGLAGVNHAGWLAQFHALAPKVRSLVAESDAATTLLGAHGGQPGVIVALGTGSIAAALGAQGEMLLAHTGATDRDSLVVWLCASNQTEYAALAPALFEHRHHPVAARLLDAAGHEIEKMALALDPDGTLPVALCGGLASPLEPFVPATLRARLRAPLADSAAGALQLARRAMNAEPMTLK